ncbi:MAG: hypothetical protein K0S93_59 [Nitrososphaeraceae archaeon]|jgi:hypothetical protein|nr:hypothetical protein [Nitrososphaeraceae archaeon]
MESKHCEECFKFANSLKFCNHEHELCLTCCTMNRESKKFVAKQLKGIYSLW